MTPRQLLADRRDAIERRFLEFLRIPSVGAQSAHDADTRRAAAWVADHLRASGFTDIQLLERDGGHPCVVARTSDAMVERPHAPRVLFYGHYDVQPADPLHLWTSPPFEPVVRDGVVYARGASDDKGQVLCFLEALRAYHDTGRQLPCPVTVCIEGEEESKGRTLPALVRQEKDLLKADICLVSDTALWEGAAGPEPSITYALRGLAYFEVRLRTLTRDLHSGVYGGTILNPANLLTRILGKLVDDGGRITIPGFYDDVPPIPPAQKKAWEDLRFDDAAFIGSVGGIRHGEAGFTTLERNWARPTCDINGLSSGYQGEGAKTVIPAEARAKVSFRLPARMDPEKVEAQFTAWIKSQVPAGAAVEILNHGGAYPVAVATDSPFIAASCRALRTVFGREPVLMGCGATIPIAADFKQELGLDTLFVGFGLNSDSIHSPDEHFGLDRLAQGCDTHVEVLAEIGKLGA